MIIFVTIWILFWYLILTGSTEMVKTYPKQRWWFNTLDWTLCPIMKLFFHGKITLKWHWKDFTDRINFGKYFAIKVDGNKTLPKVTTTWQQIKAEFKGDGQIVLDIDNADYELQGQYWQLGFYNPTTKLAKICTVKIPIKKYPLDIPHLIAVKGLVRCYVWGDDVVFFGIGPDGRQIIIQLSISSKNDQNILLI